MNAFCQFQAVMPRILGICKEKSKGMNMSDKAEGL
jgi:hypothetical protein